MKLSRNIDGNALALHLERAFGYVRISQNGSHIKLRTEAPHGHTATIPAHKPLKIGTLQAILKGIAAHKVISVATLLEDL